MDRFDDNGPEEPTGEVGGRARWIVVAEVTNRTMAEFAVNGLKSYDIPAVLDAGAGFLGTAGLELRSIYTGKLDTFKVKVPEEYEEEAAEVVKLFLGDKGSGKERSGESGNNNEESN